MGVFDRLSPEPMPRIPDGTEMPFEMKTARVIERERLDFKRPRLGHNHSFTARESGRLSKITYVCQGGGYVMARHPGCHPFVLSEDQWRAFPYWEK